jgi:YfiR/HmsC-like
MAVLSQTLPAGQKPMRRRTFLRAALLLLFLSGPFGLRAETTSREYALKAAFLYNFAQFTEWPGDAFAATNSPFVIGVLGDDPFGKALNETVQGQLMNGRKFAVERYRHVEDVKACQILFISQSESRRLGDITAALGQRPILTVSDIKDAAARGVSVQFVTEHNKIRFKINLDSLKQSKLAMSSKLLRVAQIVSPENP